MLYSKNIPGWERTTRVVKGVGLAALSVWYFGSNTTGCVVSAMGAMAMMHYSRRARAGQLNMAADAPN